MAEYNSDARIACIYKCNLLWLPSLKLTASWPWKLTVGRRSGFLLGPAIFWRHELLVSGRVSMDSSHQTPVISWCATTKKKCQITIGQTMFRCCYKGCTHKVLRIFAGVVPFPFTKIQLISLNRINGTSLWSNGTSETTFTLHKGRQQKCWSNIFQVHILGHKQPASIASSHLLAAILGSGVKGSGELPVFQIIQKTASQTPGEVSTGTRIIHQTS